MSTKDKTILVVDDQRETVELFSEMLLLTGYQVQACTNSEQAVQVIRSSPPDGVLLDVMMPEKSGLTVLEFIRNDPYYQTIPVIVISAKSMPCDISAGMDAGANQYLTKPVSYLDIRQALQDALHIE
ncbi:response regulator [bacterium]|nr:response regulator [bacterium]MCB2179421.1 response regulator [bacterium]